MDTLTLSPSLSQLSLAAIILSIVTIAFIPSAGPMSCLSITSSISPLKTAMALDGIPPKLIFALLTPSILPAIVSLISTLSTESDLLISSSKSLSISLYSKGFPSLLGFALTIVEI